VYRYVFINPIPSSFGTFTDVQDLISAFLVVGSYINLSLAISLTLPNVDFNTGYKTEVYQYFLTIPRYLDEYR